MRLARILIASTFSCALLATAAASAAPSEVEACLAASERAQRLRVAGKLGAARGDFAICAALVCPTEVRTDCTQALASLEATSPSIVVVARDAADRDVANATVSVNNGAPTPLRGEPLMLDPGPHTMRVAAPGFRTEELTVVAAVGERLRVLRVRLERDAPAPAPTLGPVSPPPEPRRATGPVPLGTILLGGVAITAVGVSAGLGLTASSEADRLNRDPCARTASCDSSDVSGLRTRLVVADVLLGAAVVSAAGALWFWLSREPSVPRPRAMR